MKRFSSVLTCVCVLFGGLRFSQAADEAKLWKTFTSQKGEFSVLMPGTPREEKQSDGALLSTEKDELVLAVMYSDYPSSGIEKLKPGELFNAARDGLLQEDGDKKSKLLDERKISQNGIDGKEFRLVTTDNIALRARVFLVKRRLYQVLVGAPRKLEKSVEKQSLKFLESFQIVVPSGSSS